MKQENRTYTTADELQEDDAFSFNQLFHQWQQNILYAFSFWRIILIAGLFGAIIGLIYAWLRPITYTARLTFVVEDSKSGAGSLASALVGQVGIDIGGLSGSNSLLSGDNVLELVKSYSFIKKALLTPYSDSTTFSLADQYAEVNGWKEKWRKDSEIGRQVNFPSNQLKSSRLEDSLLQKMVEKISEKELSISKPDKKLGIFELLVTTKDEKVSQLFCERLLSITTGFYIETKTGRLQKNVAKLERRADSLGNLLNRKTYSSASADELLLNVNPAYATSSVPAEITSRDKFMLGTIYAEVVKNLEISKTALMQETPAIQIIDNPELPLKKIKRPFLLAMALGFVLASATTGLYIVSNRKPVSISVD